MISEASLASKGAGHVHSAEEGSAVEPCVRAGIVRCLQQLSLDTRMVPLVNDVIQAVSLCKHVNLSKRKRKKIFTHFILTQISNKKKEKKIERYHFQRSVSEGQS